MAFVLNNQQDKDKQNQQQNAVAGGGQALSTNQSSTISGASGATGGQGVTPGQAKQSASGRFTNIQKYIKAGDSNQLVGQVGAQVTGQKQQAEQKLNEAKTAVDQGAAQTGQAVAAAKQANTQALSQLQPGYGQAGAISNDAFNQATGVLGKNLGLSYTGPEQLGNQQGLTQSAQNLSDIGRATQSGSGRAALLQRFFANPEYSGGEQSLDRLLLSSKAKDVRNIGQQASLFGRDVTNAQQAAQAQINAARGQVSGLVDETKGLVKGQIGNVESAVADRAKTAENIRNLLRTGDKGELPVSLAEVGGPQINTGDTRLDAALRQSISSGFINNDQLAQIQALQGRAQNAGMNFRELVSLGLLQGSETGDQLTARSANQEQVSRLGTLNKLLGQEGRAYNPYEFGLGNIADPLAQREKALYDALNTGGYIQADQAQGPNAVQDAIKRAALLGVINPVYGLQSLNLDAVGGLASAVPGGSSLLKYGTLGGYNAAQAAASALASGVGSVGGAILGGIKKLFCFDPETFVILSNGYTKKIKDLICGEELALGGKVYMIGNNAAPWDHWYDYNGVTVTGSHSVFEDGRWIRVEDSNQGKYLEPVRSDVYYAATNNHIIVTANGDIFSDAHETDGGEYLSDEITLAMLNASRRF